VTVAPELPGAIELIRWLAERSIVASIGHTTASYELARSAFDAGARSTTHLFNAMSGIDHRAPGVALAALLDDDACTELIADGIHVAPPVWELIARLKPADRLILVSDAVAMAGTTAVRGRIGTLDCEVAGGGSCWPGRRPWRARPSPSTTRFGTSSGRVSQCRRPSPPPAATRSVCWASTTAAGSRSASAPISSS
jgi:N-acetylglucosamine-6-phosphate deacetylase